MELSDDQLRAVENFQIKHDEFGSVQFLQPVDLLSASPTQDRKGIKNIPEKVVKFTRAVLSVYPDDDENPGGKLSFINFLFASWERLERPRKG